MFVSITRKEEEHILQSEQEDLIKPYKKFSLGRGYTVEKSVGCFQLARFNLSKDYKKLYCSHWEYFAMRSPYWQEKMKQFDITSDSENYKIIFQNDPDDEKYEAFYEKYGYEPDEQSCETQEKSLLEIPVMEYNIWLENCFPDVEPIIDISKKKSKKVEEGYYNNVLTFVW